MIMCSDGTYGNSPEEPAELEILSGDDYSPAWINLVLALGNDPEALAGELAKFGISRDHRDWWILRFPSVENRTEFILKWF